MGKDAGCEDATRRDEVPCRADQKIREVRAARQAADHPLGERGPAHPQPDEPFEGPLAGKVTPAGDHTVFIGIVTGGSVTDRKPLLYYRGGYASLSSG